MISTTPTKGGVRKEVGKIAGQEDRAADPRPLREEDGRGFDAEENSSIESASLDASGLEEDTSGEPIERTKTKEMTRPPRRRDELDALREVREEGVARIKDTMLRSMVLDVIEAIQQAVQDVEDKLYYLEDDDRERGERLKRMIDISKEASSKRSPAGAAGSKVENSKDQKGSKSNATGDSSSKSQESLEEKKRRLIQNLPDADPFAGE
jgi:hypothetical protein